MPRRHQHDSPKKNCFIGSVQSGLSVSEAARMHDIPQRTASSLFHKYEETGSTHARPRSGAPKKVTPRMTRAIVNESKKYRRKPLAEIGNSMTSVTSASAVRRALAEAGRHRRKARKVIYLTKAYKTVQKWWAMKYKHYCAENWEHIIWSDECYVYMGDDQGTVWITRSADEVYDDDCVIPTFKQSLLRVMVWACIMESQKGPLIVLEYPGGRGGGMTAKRYQDQVLDGPLHDFYMRMLEERDLVAFQQDGASSH
jgi:transposase